MAEYADRDARSLEPHYSIHVSAMTTEGLHTKSDIAAELAFRDAQLAKFRDAARRYIKCGHHELCDELDEQIHGKPCNCGHDALVALTEEHDV